MNASASFTDLDQSFFPKRKFFDDGHTRSYSFRLTALKALRKSLINYKSQLFEALKKDLGKPEFESLISEYGQALETVNNAISNLRTWMQPDYPGTPLMLIPSRSITYRDPKGVVVIFAPWNYPFNLAFIPLVGAIAGGNTVILKPASETPHVAQVIFDIIHESLKPEHVSVVLGDGALIGNYLLDNFTFNHIFFTGSPTTGKIIMEKAARKLSSLTLELGGKSPVIVDNTANIDTAAKKIVWGKYLNCGQTCIGPDYILVHSSVKSQFTKLVTKYINEFYGTNPKSSSNYGRIVSTQRFEKLMTYITGSKILHGGNADIDDLYIEPTVIEVDDLDHPVMQEEIFGPVMPIISWTETDELLRIIRTYRYPLATYIFTTNKKLRNFIIDNVEFGSGAVNDLMTQFGNHNLAFGGVMNSGLGRYHGSYSFECFTNPKPVIITPSWYALPVLFPPYKKWKDKLASFFLR
jgi:aldehyde dehydrogenase (NAD+)